MGNTESKPRRKQRSLSSENNQNPPQSASTTMSQPAPIKTTARTPRRNLRPSAAQPAVAPIPTKSYQEKSALMNRLVTPAQPCSARVTYIKPVTVSPDERDGEDQSSTVKNPPVVVATEIPTVLTPEDSPKYIDPSEEAPFGKLHVGARVAQGLQVDRRESDISHILNSKIQLRDDSTAEDDEDDSEDYYYKNNLTYGLRQLRLGTDVGNMNIEVVGRDAVSKPMSRVDSGEEVEFRYQGSDELSNYNGARSRTAQTKISYNQGGSKVYITGTFTGWRKMLPMDRNPDGTFSVILDLPQGTHRFRFVVDGELKCADDISTATDSSGFLVNYLDVDNEDPGDVSVSFSEENIPLCRECDLKNSQTSQPPPQATTNAGHTHKEDDITQYEEYYPSIPPLEYTNEIPNMFLTLDGAELDIPENQAVPPHLPPHLDTVILNTNSNEKDDSSVLPAPNHVVLNHLATSSIKHNVLAVASVNRYGKKFVTQILHAPMPTLN